ncbi:MAG: hypothetical protein ACLPVY_17630 [Acidimicrobiia bacterium]
MSIKDSAETWVRGAPGQAMILVAAVGIVIGGVAGLGGGFKIEQNRTKADVKQLRAQLQARAPGTAATAGGSLGQRIGKVTDLTAETITLQTKRKGDQAVHTTSTTLFEQLTKGSNADIAVGDRILVTLSGTEVIVLPASSKLGRMVTAVTSTSIALAKGNSARAGSIPINKVRVVDTTTPAQLSDFKAGSEVLAGGRGTGQNFSAVEVILLPAGSGFTN